MQIQWGLFEERALDKLGQSTLLWKNKQGRTTRKRTEKSTEENPVLQVAKICQ